MNKPTVADPTPRVAELEEKRKLIRTIQGGTFAMRAAGEKYLPKHPAESEGVYKTRLQKTFLDNFVGLAIDKAWGKIFAKPIKTENLPPDIEATCENIDRQGRDLDSFMADVAKQAFEDGITYVLADMPSVDGELTVAQQKALGIAPYAVHLKPCCILEPRHEMINGKETLTLLRWKECVIEPDGEWGCCEIEQVRVLRRVATVEADGKEKVVVMWEIYREVETNAGQKEWQKVKEGPTAFKSIYLVPFYTNRVGFLEGEPGFKNIAESTLEHWQWKSEHAHALSMCCFGMYFATGVEDGFKMEVGPAKALASTNPDAKFGVVETTGKGVELAEKALAAIESRIESAGVNLRVENAGKVTATAAAIDSEDTNAGVKAVSEGFSDSIEQLFGHFAEMMGIEAKDMSADCNTDFGVAKGTPAGLTEWGKLRALGDVSRAAILSEFKRRGEADEEFDIDADKALLDAEGPALGGMGGQSANTETV